MTLVELINAWWEDGTPVLVTDAKYLDDVFDTIFDGGEINRSDVDFAFVPQWSRWKCSIYLKEKWAFGEVEAFTKLEDGARIIAVKPWDGTLDEGSEE